MSDARSSTNEHYMQDNKSTFKLQEKYRKLLLRNDMHRNYLQITHRVKVNFFLNK